jgi:hypothetical protein
MGIRISRWRVGGSLSSARIIAALLLKAVALWLADDVRKSRTPLNRGVAIRASPIDAACARETVKKDYGFDFATRAKKWPIGLDWQLRVPPRNLKQ